MRDSYYKPSGSVSASFFGYYFLFLLLSVPILSIAYIYAIHYIPLIYLNVIITIGCGALLGLVVSFAAKKGKARNPVLVLVFTLLGVCILKYVQWGVYVPLVFSEVYGEYLGYRIPFFERFSETAFLLRSPAELLEMGKFINEVGVWSAFDADFTGIALLIVWIMEFVILAGIAAAFAWSQPRQPFSEESNDWYTEKINEVYTIIPENIEAMKNELETGDYAGLVQLASHPRTDELNFLSLSFFLPPEDSKTEPHYMSIKQSTEKKKKSVMKDLVCYISIDEKYVNEIKENAEKAAQAAPEPNNELDSMVGE